MAVPEKVEVTTYPQDEVANSEALIVAALPTNEELRAELQALETELSQRESFLDQAYGQNQITVADFEELFTHYRGPLSNYAYRMIGNREQAYDLTQDVFVKAYRALANGTTIQAAALSSWLYRITANTTTDALRRRRLITWLPLSLFNDDRGVGAGMTEEGPALIEGSTGGSAMFGHDRSSPTYTGNGFEDNLAEKEEVEEALKRLPPKYMKVLLLYEHEGFSCAEIGEVLGVSPSAVKMRLMRARDQFKVLLKLIKDRPVGSSSVSSTDPHEQAGKSRFAEPLRDIAGNNRVVGPVQWLNLGELAIRTKQAPPISRATPKPTTAETAIPDEDDRPVAPKRSRARQVGRSTLQAGSPRRAVPLTARQLEDAAWAKADTAATRHALETIKLLSDQDESDGDWDKLFE